MDSKQNIITAPHIFSHFYITSTFYQAPFSQHQVDILKNLLYFFLNYFYFTFPNSPHSYLIHGPLPPKWGYLRDLDIETTPPALELNQSNNLDYWTENLKTLPRYDLQNSTLPQTQVSEHNQKSVKKIKPSYGTKNQLHNILELFNVLPNFSFTTSEMMGFYYLKTCYI